MIKPSGAPDVPADVKGTSPADTKSPAADAGPAEQQPKKAQMEAGRQRQGPQGLPGQGGSKSDMGQRAKIQL